MFIVFYVEAQGLGRGNCVKLKMAIKHKDSPLGQKTQ